jgi:hypothetical protein
LFIGLFYGPDETGLDNSVGSGREWIGEVGSRSFGLCSCLLLVVLAGLCRFVKIMFLPEFAKASKVSRTFFLDYI